LVFNALGTQFEAEEQVVWLPDYRRIKMVQPPRAFVIGVGAVEREPRLCDAVQGRFSSFARTGMSAAGNTSIRSSSW
jgi:hypothetical protein